MKLFNIAHYRYYSPIYIESGSCLGESIQRALNAGFTKCKSVEAYEPFYHKCVKRFPGGDPVQLYLGKSYDQLPEMLDDIYEPAVIFLDAHPAGKGTFGHDEIMQKDMDYSQHNIITRELAVILQHRNDHLIILDDISGPNPEADIYISMMTSYNPNYEFKFLDEQLEGQSVVKDKILVCVPRETLAR